MRSRMKHLTVGIVPGLLTSVILGVVIPPVMASPVQPRGYLQTVTVIDPSVRAQLMPLT